MKVQIEELLDHEALLRLESGATSYAVCSKHKNFIGYLEKYYTFSKPFSVLTFPTHNDVKEKIIIGELPFHLATSAFRVISFQIEVPPAWAGDELSISQLEAITYAPRVVKVCNTDLIQAVNNELAGWAI